MFLFPVLNLPVEYETVVLNYVEEIADHLVLSLLLENVSCILQSKILLRFGRTTFLRT